MSIPYDIVFSTRRKLIQQSAEASETYHIGAAPMIILLDAHTAALIGAAEALLDDDSVAPDVDRQALREALGALQPELMTTPRDD